LKRLTVLLLTILIALIVIFNFPALAESTDKGAKIFSVHCAGCHVNGGNIIRRNKTLKKKALQRNQMDSSSAIANIVANGKNNMSAYSDRLTQQEIEAVAAYVLEQAEKNWQS
jgi:cytochrome c6